MDSHPIEDILRSTDRTRTAHHCERRRTRVGYRAVQKDCACAGSSVSFLPVVTYDPAGQSIFISIADVNGDANPDLLVTNACIAVPGSNHNSDCSESSIGVLLGNGDGTFKPVVIYKSGGDVAYSLAVADVNGDGKPDLLVTNWAPSE